MSMDFVSRQFRARENRGFRSVLKQSLSGQAIERIPATAVLRRWHGLSDSVLSAEEVRRFRAASDELETRLGGKPRTVDVRQMHLHFPWAYDLAVHPSRAGCRGRRARARSVWSGPRNCSSNTPTTRRFPSAGIRIGPTWGSRPAPRPVPGSPWPTAFRPMAACGRFRDRDATRSSGHGVGGGPARTRNAPATAVKVNEDEAVDVVLLPANVAARYRHRPRLRAQPLRRRNGSASWCAMSPPRRARWKGRPPALLARGHDPGAIFSWSIRPANARRRRRCVACVIRRLSIWRPCCTIWPWCERHDHSHLQRTTMDLKDTIRNYVTDSFLTEGQTATIQDDDDLMEVLDSLQILRMVADVEKRFSIQVDNSDLTPENFGSVEKLAAFIQRKQQLTGRLSGRPLVSTAMPDIHHSFQHRSPPAAATVRIRSWSAVREQREWPRPCRRPGAGAPVYLVEATDRLGGTVAARLDPYAGRAVRRDRRAAPTRTGRRTGRAACMRRDPSVRRRRMGRVLGAQRLPKRLSPCRRGVDRRGTEHRGPDRPPRMPRSSREAGRVSGVEIAGRAGRPDFASQGRGRRDRNRRKSCARSIRICSRTTRAGRRPD